MSDTVPEKSGANVDLHDSNRPVHLARRDVCVERAVERLSQPLQRLATAERIARVEGIIALLRTASQHARLAARSARAGERERDFLRFLGLTLQHVELVQALIRNQEHLESREHGFLSKFLGVSPDEVALSAINFQRRAEDLLEGLWQVLRMSGTPYRELQRENLSGLSAEERERYERACESFRSASDAVTEAPSPVAPLEVVARNAPSPAGSEPDFAI